MRMKYGSFSEVTHLCDQYNDHQFSKYVKCISETLVSATSDILTLTNDLMFQQYPDINLNFLIMRLEATLSATDLGELIKLDRMFSEKHTQLPWKKLPDKVKFLSGFYGLFGLLNDSWSNINPSIHDDWVTNANGITVKRGFDVPLEERGTVVDFIHLLAGEYLSDLISHLKRTHHIDQWSLPLYINLEFIDPLLEANTPATNLDIAYAYEKIHSISSLTRMHYNYQRTPQFYTLLLDMITLTNAAIAQVSFRDEFHLR